MLARTVCVFGSCYGAYLVILLIRRLRAIKSLFLLDSEIAISQVPQR
jgi:hypothetical protein